MSANSYRKYFEFFETTAWTPFSADEPISAYTAWITRNNIQHLVDQSGQYRVNWVADVDDVTGGDGGAEITVPGFHPTAHQQGSTTVIRYVFPLTSIRPDRPMQLDIRIGARSQAGGTVTINADLVPYKRPSQILWSATQGQTTSATASWIIDELATWTDESRHRTHTPFTSVDNDASSVPGVSILDLVELEIRGSCSAGSGLLSGVQVREYP